MRRLLLPLVLLAACTAQEEVPTPELEEEVLDVVVDSLPFTIRFTWGDGEEHPYTAVLNAEALPAPGEESSGLGYGESPRAVSELGAHGLDWLARQEAKPHVAALCRTSRNPGPCRAGTASMTATLSRPAFSGLDVARVEVLLRRQVGDPPSPWGPGGPFRALLVLRLEEGDDGSWAVQYLRLVDMGM